MKNLLWLVRYAIAVLLGPRVPKVRAGFCDQNCCVVVMIGGDNLPNFTAAGGVPAESEDCIVAVLSPGLSETDLFQICACVITTDKPRKGCCRMVRVGQGDEVQRIARQMRQSAMFTFMVYMAIHREAFRLFYGSAKRWRAVSLRA